MGATFGSSGGVSQAALDAHAADETDVHGIADTGALIVEGDSRLTDARAPTAHSHPQSDVTGLAGALSAKQDSATAATDAELAGAVATINAAIALKQDASNAATDSELAAHEADSTSVHGIADTSLLVVTSDPRLADERVPTAASVTAAKVNGALKPSGSAAAGDEALRALGTGATQAAAGDDGRFPTSGQKNALAGTSGTPGTGNKYVTDGDARNSDARTPTAHTHAESEVTGLVADLAAKASTTDLTTRVPDALPDMTGAGDANKVPMWDGSTLAKVEVYSKALSDVGYATKPDKSTLTTKGDIYVASAASTPQRLGSGTNEDVLISDSAQSTGRKQGIPIAGFRAWVPVYVSGTAPRGTGATALSRASINIAAGSFASSGSNDSLVALIPIFAADLNLTGRTTKLKCRAVVGTGNTSPNMNFTVGLSLISASVGPANDQQNFTWGASVTGADKLLAINNTATVNTINGDAFDLPADGWYVLHLTTSATNPVNCRWNAGLSLLMSHV